MLAPSAGAAKILTLLQGQETVAKLVPSDGEELTITGTPEALRVVVVEADQEPKQHKIAVGGEGGWDYLTVDSAARRLFVSRGNRVVVIDLTGKIEARGVPDAILYDSVSKRVFTFNHGTNDATVIDSVGESVVGTILFDSEPEAAVADGRGHVFVNLRSTSEVAEIDAASLKILHRWPLAPGVRPNGLGFDAKYRRLFSTCRNQRMVVMDANTGFVLSTAGIGQDSDGCVFDPGTERAYSSNGDGAITVVRETKRRNYVPGSFSIIVVGD